MIGDLHENVKQDAPLDSTSIIIYNEAQKGRMEELV
jgi:hypothetical protein